MESQDSFVMSFSANQWVTCNEQCYLDVTHGLESDNLVIQVYDEANKVLTFNHVTDFPTLNTIRLRTKNTVFSGSIKITSA